MAPLPLLLFLLELSSSSLFQIHPQLISIVEKLFLERCLLSAHPVDMIIVSFLLLKKEKKLRFKLTTQTLSPVSFAL